MTRGKMETKTHNRGTMKVEILSRDFELTEAIEKKVLDNIFSLDKYYKGNKEIKVNLFNRSEGQEVEVLLSVEKHLLKASELTEDLYKSVDLIVDTLKAQLTKLSDKNADNNRHSIKFLEPKSQIVVEEIPGPKIVKRKFIAAKPMFEEEAVLQMDLLNHRSFIFLNADTEEPCMAYKRNDGNYGIIELA